MALVAWPRPSSAPSGVRFARSTSDFLVASRTVGPAANAGAISGEYLSAASFLGVAGLILRDGVDALWYPVGFTAGYLALLLFVAAPLRRSGAYTVPDFAEARLRSPALRKVCTLVRRRHRLAVPAAAAAGRRAHRHHDHRLPAWIGAVAAAVVVVAHAWCSAACARSPSCRPSSTGSSSPRWPCPRVLGLIFFLSDERTFDRAAPPQFPEQTTVDIRTDVRAAGADPVTLTATGEVDGVPVNGAGALGHGHAHRRRGQPSWSSRAGRPVPVVAGAPATDASWLTPYPARPGARAARHVLADHRAVPGHHGAAARAGALLHQPGRPGGPPHRGDRAGAARRVLPGGHAARRAVPALRPAAAGQRRHRRRGAAAAHAPCWAAAGSARCWPRWSPPAPGRRSCPRRPGLVVSIAGVLSTDVLRSSRVRDFRVADGDRRRGAARALPRRHPAGLLRGGLAGLRGRGVHVLPAAGAGHLVAGPDRPGAIAGVLVGGVRLRRRGGG